jgi:hypothetical protein
VSRCAREQHLDPQCRVVDTGLSHTESDQATRRKPCFESAVPTSARTAGYPAVTGWLIERRRVVRQIGGNDRSDSQQRLRPSFRIPPTCPQPDETRDNRRSVVDVPDASKRHICATLSCRIEVVQADALAVVKDGRSVPR